MLATETFRTSDGHRVRWARAGRGHPVVMLHGYPENLQIWSALAPLLADRFSVVALDWPGLGESDAWPGGATPDHMAERLHALLQAWRLERVTLLAMDMGAPPAVALAVHHPERVASLVLMNSLLQWDAPTSWEIALLRRFAWNRVVLRRLPRLVFARAEATFLPRGAPLPEELRAEFWRSFRREEVRAFIIKMCAGYQGTLPGLPALFPSIRCPTLLLWGAEERHFPLAHARRVQESMPGALLDVVPGAAHWMAWSHPGQVAAAVAQAVASLA